MKRALAVFVVLTSLFCAGCKRSSINSPAGVGENASVTPGPAVLTPGDKSQPRQTPSLNQVKETRTGIASFTSESLQGVQTYSGETFDNNKPVAAHPSYPMGTIVRVINLRNNHAVEVRVIDRSASIKPRGGGYIISLSRLAAEQLDFIRNGKVQVRTEVLEWGRKS